MSDTKIKNIAQEIENINAVDLKENLVSTLEHTVKAISCMSTNLSNIQNSGKILGIDVDTSGTDPIYLSMLMFIHDFYKLKANKDHAEKGFEFLENPINLNLIRFHDIFGVIHTGEASLLFLEDFKNFVDSINSEKERMGFLNSLILITAADVYSYGFLDDKRIQTYNQIKEDILSNKSLESLAKGKTADRLQKLIQSNLRFKVDLRVIEIALDMYSEKDDFIDRLMYVRFDAGAYVLEPYLRYLKDSSSVSLENKDAMDAPNEKITKWFKIIHNVLKKNNITNHKKIIDLSPYSIKGLDLDNDRSVEKIKKFKLDFA